MTIAPGGALSLRYDGMVVFATEQLQLIDRRAGWRAVYSYGKSGTVKVERKGTSGRILERLPNIIVYRKDFGVSPQGVAWQMSWESPGGVGATDCFYFIDIPMATVSDAWFEWRGGETSARGWMSGGVPGPKGMEYIRFVTSRMDVEYALTAENATWQLTDWTNTEHKSYRLRIEQPATTGVRATIGVRVTVRDSSQELVEDLARAASEENRRLREQRRLRMGLRMRQPLRLGAMTVEPATVVPGEKVEITFPLHATFDNPFDPDDVNVSCAITTPEGGRVDQPAFFYVPYQSGDNSGPQRAGSPVWKVRFTPLLRGEYRFHVRARDRTGVATSEGGRFHCAGDLREGFVRVSPTHPTRLQFDSGNPFVPCGINLFFPTRLRQPIPADRLSTLAGYVKRLADNDGNFVRLRMDSWWLPIEMTADGAAGYEGVGWYHQQTCWEIDQLYEQCRRLGVSIMHCLDNANGTVNLPDGPVSGRNQWRGVYNLYVKENGGPLDKPSQFWTDPEVGHLVRRKLRYCVARWAYSRQLMAWEFWNEVSCRAATVEAMVGWHRDMARYLRSIDNWHHPITTSAMGDEALQSKLWSLPEMEIVQRHIYRQPDIASAMAAAVRDAPPGKPLFFGEFGIGPMADGREGQYDFDSRGVHLHNGLWGPLMSGAAGPGAFWYVSSYLDRRDLWHLFRPLTAWTASIPWLARDLRALSSPRLRFKVSAHEHTIDYVLPTSTRWLFKEPPVDEFVIGQDGSVSNAESLRPHLYAGAGRKRPPTFVLNADRPCQLVVRVQTSVGDERNRLLVFLDGRKVVDRTFPAGKDKGTSQRYIEQYDNWICSYDTPVSIDIPAGKHRLRLEAQGKDRLEVQYLLRDYVVFERMKSLRVSGFQTAERAWLWLQNVRSTWSHLLRKEDPVPVVGAQIELTGLRPGRYHLQWLDPWTGEMTGEATVETRDQRLLFELPPIERDMAGHVEHRD